ncbi:C69 family dipeptidase [Lactobacillus sp. DCY120]|uniref:Dipeptidase n=1 Tax=Bombilactobacillus apium TaxID=2675299 RepID=A0A850RB88_9LACO|nr:C69 family dipeptidase [Bombilactobacillus apium]NVY96068.1 C69 family dipeptidase [Bombilactobacillus apium]
MTHLHSSCTTILVGKKATIDGSTMIARTEDHSDYAEPQQFVVVNPADQPRHYQAKLAKFALDLPENPRRYTATPDADRTHGEWGGSGINSANVAMTATETITTNDRVLAADPLVNDGLSEEDLLTIVLPYLDSARAGVLRVGQLLEQYGTYESNGMAFADQDEIWYLETLGGHHWAAVKIPDDAYVVAPNRLNIAEFDLEAEDVLYSADLADFIQKNHLNPDAAGLNLRHTFGSATIKDTHYNNPRAWYVQKFFTPSVVQDPLDHNLPFICHPEKKIGIAELKWALSSHYQNTPYDCYGDGTSAEKKCFRPIGINRNEETHILQIRPDKPSAATGLQWLAFGPNTFNTLVPFYTQVSTTPESFRRADANYDPTTAYWLSRTLGVLGDTDYGVYSEYHAQYEQATLAQLQAIVAQTDRKLTQVTDPTPVLEAANQQLADCYMKESQKLLGKMVLSGSKHMKLKFSVFD